MIQKTAKYLEHRLYESSGKHNLDEYTDLATLDARMRTLAAIQLNNRLLQKTKLNSHNCHNKSREECLQHVIGLDAFPAARDLVKEIRLEQQRLVASNCAECQANGTCSIQSGPTLWFDETMPAEVRGLYFGTMTLLNAFDKSPVEQLQRIDWDEVLLQSKAALEAYRTWKAANSIPR